MNYQLHQQIAPSQLRIAMHFNTMINLTFKRIYS